MEGKIGDITGNKKLIVIIAGASGVGKSTIGLLLSKKMNVPFVEGDQFHSQSSIYKMQSNIPLTDQDRMPWLFRQLSLNGESAVLSCSALKSKYREILVQKCDNCKFVWLYGSQLIIKGRVQKRDNHFMKANMIESQFNDIEKPKNAICINVSQSKADIVKTILLNIEKN